MGRADHRGGWEGFRAGRVFPARPLIPTALVRCSTAGMKRAAAGTSSPVHRRDPQAAGAPRGWALERARRGHLGGGPARELRPPPGDGVGDRWPLQPPGPVRVTHTRHREAHASHMRTAGDVPRRQSGGPPNASATPRQGARCTRFRVPGVCYGKALAPPPTWPPGAGHSELLRGSCPPPRVPPCGPHAGLPRLVV